MTIVVTGGGSGGHITPVLAVANALKQLQPDVTIVYIGQKGDGLGDVPAHDPHIDLAENVSAGKLRRYHGEGLKQLLDLKTVFLNVRDVFRTLAGIVQAYRLLRHYNPDCVFIKGGFVGVPVGLAAAFLKIPYVTHDSDAIPGLANRIIAPWARYHAVALPKELYHYESQKTFTVGVPTHTEYKAVFPVEQASYKQSLGLATTTPVLLVTGGGLGAARLNEAVVSIAPDLLKALPELHIFHTVGRTHETSVGEQYAQLLPEAEQGRVHVIGYTTELYRYSGAADLILMRAGATAIAEFAVQGKACVLVPNPLLTGGHQLKNAEALKQSGAVAILDERAMTEDRPMLLATLEGLLADSEARETMARKFAKFGHPNAATELSEVILKAAGSTKEAER